MAVYELLDNFCEFIRSNLSYIRKNKYGKSKHFYSSNYSLTLLPYFSCNELKGEYVLRDCPNDINEAASSLIYASSRCGDLPELSKIRELFEERYGQRFALASAELLPGNLVNCQVGRYSVSSFLVIGMFYYCKFNNHVSTDKRKTLHKFSF